MADKKIVMFYPNVYPEASHLVQQVLRSRWIGQGGQVNEFETHLKNIFNIPHAVAVNCGSSALRLALAIAGIGPGDEVITTAQCCTATNHPILEQFARPVFADIQYPTGNIDPADAIKRITPKTKAIIGVDLGGYPCDAEELQAIAQKNNLVFIQDASDSLGAKYKNKFMGTLARFTVFSFGAVLQVTTAEGGALCCLDDNDAKEALRRRWYAIDRKCRKPDNKGYYDFDITEVGYGYHLSNISAAIGLAHLPHLSQILSRRAQIFNLYMDNLKPVAGIQLFEHRSDRVSAHQLFTIHVKDRDEFCRMMRDKGIELSIVHARNDQYTIFGGRRKDLPELDRYEKTNISLPIHNKLTDEDVSYIIKSIKNGW